ncbi:MAG TPA: ELM1/GtrOC1 family putative glycosyltransferase [Sphingomicrobium sp.]|nr:ELM1/GtrOC1 family putative glycosyltransferase [Sphingomicrobium sp.]
MNNKTGQKMRVWALLGPHRGDNNQVLALAEALRLPFEEKLLRYNQLRRLQPSLLGATLMSVAASDREQLEGEPPDLTISTGHRSVPVVRALRKRSGGRMRAVHLGYPRIAPANFDLVVPTPEYPVPDASNVLRIPFALSPHKAREIEQSDRDLLAAYPRPHRLFLIGGPTLYWQLPVGEMVEAVRHLLHASAVGGGSVIAVGSPRTPAELLAAIKSILHSSSVPFLFAPIEGPPAYPAMIEGADEIYVTADSVAMVADAVLTGKPVAIVPIAKSAAGRVVMAAADRLRPGKRLFPRDLRFFWKSLEEHGFGGTIENPRASEPPDFTLEIAKMVRRLLQLPPEPARTGPDTARRVPRNRASRGRGEPLS